MADASHNFVTQNGLIKICETRFFSKTKNSKKYKCDIILENTLIKKTKIDLPNVTYGKNLRGLNLLD